MARLPKASPHPVRVSRHPDGRDLTVRADTPNSGGYPQRDSNPCNHLERVVTWTASRWGRVDRSDCVSLFALGRGRAVRREVRDVLAGPRLCLEPCPVESLEDERQAGCGLPAFTSTVVVGVVEEDDVARCDPGVARWAIVQASRSLASRGPTSTRAEARARGLDHPEPRQAEDAVRWPIEEWCETRWRGRRRRSHAGCRRAAARGSSGGGSDGGSRAIQAHARPRRLSHDFRLALHLLAADEEDCVCLARSSSVRTATVPSAWGPSSKVRTMPVPVGARVGSGRPGPHAARRRRAGAQWAAAAAPAASGTRRRKIRWCAAVPRRPAGRFAPVAPTTAGDSPPPPGRARASRSRWCRAAGGAVNAPKDVVSLQRDAAEVVDQEVVREREPLAGCHVVEGVPEPVGASLLLQLPTGAERGAEAALRVSRGSG